MMTINQAAQNDVKWKSLLLNPSAEINANALSLTVKNLFEAILEYGQMTIDLRGLPIEKVNGVHLAVILRATFSKKNNTPGWDEALLIVKDALKRDGLDEANVLFGLI